MKLQFWFSIFMSRLRKSCMGVKVDIPSELKTYWCDIYSLRCKSLGMMDKIYIWHCNWGNVSQIYRIQGITKYINFEVILYQANPYVSLNHHLHVFEGLCSSSFDHPFACYIAAIHCIGCDRIIKSLEIGEKCIINNDL